MQLDDTSGTAKIPNSVVRLLNSRACRSALMFGDTLNEKQATALVDALKETRLSFICAHGRPTLVPLLDLQQVYDLRQLHRAENANQCEVGLHEIRKVVKRHLEDC